MIKKDRTELSKILNKMCTIAGVDINKIDFLKKNWYDEHEWTTEQSSKFEKWLLTFLTDNKSAQRELFDMTITTKKLLQKAVSQFILYYTFKINDNKK